MAVTPTERPPRHRLPKGCRVAVAVAVPVLMFAVVVACVATPVLLVRQEFRERAEAEAADRARAERVVEQRARDYADAAARQIARAGPAGVPDDRLHQLADDQQVTIQTIDRDPDQSRLAVVVRASEPYSGWIRVGPGSLRVDTCFEIVFPRPTPPSDGYGFVELDRCQPAR